LFCNKIKLKNFLLSNLVGGCGVAPFRSNVCFGRRFGHRVFKYRNLRQKMPALAG